MISMATAVFFENLYGGMGTAAFVALRDDVLCNKSFSATQFAPFLCPSAVGRVRRSRRGLVCWKPNGWLTFYLFSVVAAVPGILLLLVCRQTLNIPSGRNTSCRARNIRLLTGFTCVCWMAGCLALVVWLAVHYQCDDHLVASFETQLLDAGYFAIVVS